MTYIEHARDCRIFLGANFINRTCNCRARFIRAPEVMGPHEKDCPYLTQMVKDFPQHGICYCSAHPDHDERCTGMACWERRKGLLAPPIDKVG